MFDRNKVDPEEDCVLYLAHKHMKYDDLSSPTITYEFEPLWVLTGTHTREEQLELLNLFTHYYSQVTDEPMMACIWGRKVWRANITESMEII